MTYPQRSSSWHTTGSGKTLTSFKASTLLEDNPAIASCLSSHDDLIAAQAAKIEALKKGLMQQLFPVPEAAV